MGNSYIPQGIRNAVSKRDRGICQHCGLRAAKAEVSNRGALRFFGADEKVFHLDHVVPVSQGGEDSMENLKLACAGCNLGKRRAVAANDPEVQSILEEFA